MFSDYIMKVLVINPWTGNIAAYTHGLCEGLANYCDVTLVTNYYDNNISENYKIKKSFFKISDQMERNALRKAIRGFEYICTYNDIIRIVRNEKFDIVHVQWFLIYKLDVSFITKLKKYCKVVLTAHNVLPHVNGEKYREQLKSIYQLVDLICVHGESIRNEFIKYYPESIDKVIIQHHGDMMHYKTDYNDENIPVDIKNKLSVSGKKYIFFGNIFYNKGTDILLKTWLHSFIDSDSLLIIAGRTTENFPEFDELCNQIDEHDNVLLINKYVDDNELNYLIHNSNVIVLPYRHATMSGVVFTGAQFKKPIVCTEAGSIVEYVREGFDCFICEPTEESLETVMIKINNEFTNDDLAEMGVNLYNHIQQNFSWIAICKKLVLGYESLINT